MNFEGKRFGKGMKLGWDRLIDFKLKKLALYLPDKSELEDELKKIPEELLEKYDSWPALWKFAALDPECQEYFQPEKQESLKHLKGKQPSILSNTLHYCFEKYFGYPKDSFVSLSDSNESAMIFCDVCWPPKHFDSVLASLTEDMLADQLHEFLLYATETSYFAGYMIEMCGEDMHFG